MIVIPASLRSDVIHMAGMAIHIALESTIHIVGIRTPADFVAQFASESERRAAILVFDALRELRAAKRMPRLEKGDQITGPPLFLAEGDVEERLETLFEELDFSLWL